MSRYKTITVAAGLLFFDGDTVFQRILAADPRTVIGRFLARADTLDHHVGLAGRRLSLSEQILELALGDDLFRIVVAVFIRRIFDAAGGDQDRSMLDDGTVASLVLKLPINPSVLSTAAFR